MKDYVIITDSTTDLPFEYAQAKNLNVLPLGFIDVNGNEYKNTLDHKDMPIKDFYKKMRDGATFKTNQINIQTYKDFFESFIKDNKDIIAISFSSGLSGSYNSACVARNLILEEYPDAKITVIDSLCASLGEGLLVHYALKAIEDGKYYEQVVSYIETLKHDISHWLTVDDIDTLKRGGRLSGGAAFVAKTLKIKPVLYVSPEGKLVARTKKIGRKNAMNEVVEKLVSMYDKERNDIFFISHGDCIDEVLYVKKRISELTGIDNFVINEVGPVIGSHAGPGVLAVFFVSKGR